MPTANLNLFGRVKRSNTTFSTSTVFILEIPIWSNLKEKYRFDGTSLTRNDGNELSTEDQRGGPRFRGRCRNSFSR
ncbi:hypothetical protein TcasGA2_TC003108 [Tribolium castaneum]|uniref:Uncharacterized protein n=1 Tax=Tribolium castaneum TaxID=7070 RepID=D6WFB4_TRICA|nr:hypothetical protein TcasGA2_TC003108 [Tribolium castaneum]